MNGVLRGFLKTQRFIIGAKDRRHENENENENESESESDGAGLKRGCEETCGGGPKRRDERTACPCPSVLSKWQSVGSVRKHVVLWERRRRVKDGYTMSERVIHHDDQLQPSFC